MAGQAFVTLAIDHCKTVTEVHSMMVLALILVGVLVLCFAVMAVIGPPEE